METNMENPLHETMNNLMCEVLNSEFTHLSDVTTLINQNVDFFENYFQTIDKENELYAVSMNNLGYIYENKRNLVNSEKYYKISANLGCPMGQYNLGNYYLKRNCRYRDAYKYLKLASEHFEIALFLIGTMYQNGHYFIQDYNKAIDCYLNSQSTPESNINLGNMYQYGIGVLQNLDIARNYFVTASSMGYNDAANHLRSLNCTQEIINYKFPQNDFSRRTMKSFLETNQFPQVYKIKFISENYIQNEDIRNYILNLWTENKFSKHFEKNNMSHSIFEKLRNDTANRLDVKRTKHSVTSVQLRTSNQMFEARTFVLIFDAADHQSTELVSIGLVLFHQSKNVVFILDNLIIFTRNSKMDIKKVSNDFLMAIPEEVVCQLLQL
jgi:hypothetical protein